MATVGQITTEFITRGEAYFHKNIGQLLEDLDDGFDDAWDRLAFAHDLYMFLVELQTLYNDWTDREILTMVDYYDSTYNLKALQTAIPDPYRAYENATTVTTQTVLLEAPAGNGLIEKTGDTLRIFANEDIINSDYGLD